MEIPKPERLREVYRRLAAAPASRSFAEMRQQLADVLNEVEDALTAIPYDPARWATDGRLYPVQDDNVHDVHGHPDVVLLRARGSRVYIGGNGAIGVRDVVPASYGSASRGRTAATCGSWADPSRLPTR